MTKYNPALLWLDAPWMETNCDVATNSDRNATTRYGYGCKVDRALDFAGQASLSLSVSVSVSVFVSVCLCLSL